MNQARQDRTGNSGMQECERCLTTVSAAAERESAFARFPGLPPSRSVTHAGESK